MKLSSTAFTDGGDIPREHTCDGADLPIPLRWSDAPFETAEFALVMDDPDARGFVHWVVVGLPPGTTELIAGSLPSGAAEGRNDFGRNGYGGPCPPSGSHRYTVTLLALSEPLGLGAGVTADAVRQAARDRTLAEGRLTGRYARQR